MADTPPPAPVIFRFVAPAERPRRVAAHAVDLAPAPRLDVEAARTFLTWAEFDVHRSFIDGVAPVPWGVTVEARADGILRTRLERGPEEIVVSDDQAPRRVRRRLEAAVEEALEPHARAAVLASGGLDSSLVACAAAAAWRRLDRDPDALRLYHLLPPAGPTEVEHARALAAAVGHPLVEVPYPPGDLLSSMDAVLGRLSHPVDDVEVGASLALVQAAADEGSTCYLTGDGGDELFGTYAVRDYAGGPGVGPVRRAGRTLNWHFAARGWPRLARPRPWGEGPPDLPWLADARAPRRPEHHPRPRRGLAGERAWRDRTVRCARQHILMDWHRALGAVAEIEPRAPLLDPRVVDLLVSLPAERFRGSPPKSLARRAFADVLPPPLRARPKDQPASEPHILSALRAHGQRWTAELLRDGVLVSRGLLDVARVDDLLPLAARGPLDRLFAGVAALGTEVWARACGLA